MMRPAQPGLETGARDSVIDMAVIVAIHGLLLIAGYRLMLRDDLDEDPLLEGDDDGAADERTP
jgi:hypothetical protein